MRFQWSSSGLPVVFQCVPIMQINPGSPLEHHWELASASVVPMTSQCTCGSSGLPVCSNYANQHWIASGTSLGASSSQKSSSGMPMYWCVSIMQINTGSPLEHHWELALASVVPMASQCNCGSSGLPVCFNYANQHWIATGTSLGASSSQKGSSGMPVYLWVQWSSSVICPVVSQSTDRIWFGGHWVR